MANFNVEKALEQHTKVIDLIKEECNKNGVAFYSFSYFRTGDSLKKGKVLTYGNRTPLHRFDERHIKKIVDQDFTCDIDDD